MAEILRISWEKKGLSGDFTYGKLPVDIYDDLPIKRGGFPWLNVG